METNHLFVEKVRMGCMKLEASLVKANLLEKGIRKSIDERIMDIGSLIWRYLEEVKLKHVL